MENYWVYIITNYTNTVIYTGITNNLERKINEHRAGILPKSFSVKYNLYKLVWFTELSSNDDAIQLEKKIKGWTRIKKINLIQKNNPRFKDLFRY